MNDDKKILDFLNRYHGEFISLGLRNSDKEGYVSLMVDKDFELLGEIKFVEEKVKSKDYLAMGTDTEDNTDEAVESQWVYVQIAWSSNFKLSRLKYLVVTFKTTDSEKFKI